MKNVFLLLAITGIAAPYYFIYKFIEANNWEWSTTLFFEQISANPGMKILNADINPILHKIAHFTRVNKENKKRDKSHKQDLSRCVAGAGLEPATFGL